MALSWPVTFEPARALAAMTASKNRAVPAQPAIWWQPGYISSYKSESRDEHDSTKTSPRKIAGPADRSRHGALRGHGLDADRELIRALARRLAEEGPEAARIRSTMQRAIAGEPPRKGGILEALRRSPLVGADLDLARPREEGRRIDL
jgi:hypothetical protein